MVVKVPQPMPRGDQTPTTWWPGLKHLPWSSIGHPSARSNTDSGACVGSAAAYGPMFSLALQHSQIQRPGAAVPVYQDHFNCAIRLQDACLIHWPCLSSLDFSTDWTILNWLSLFLKVFKTPSAAEVNHLLPGYQAPDAVLTLHVHLERTAFTWFVVESNRMAAPFTTPSSNNLRLDSVRAFVGCESLSVTIDSATGTTHLTAPGIGPVSSLPGILIMAFLIKVTVFICPVYRKATSTSKQAQWAQVPTLLLQWLQSLDLSESVCVIDLNRLELRCFSEPSAAPPTVSSDSPDLVPYRMDFRFTNNLLRVSACADTLIALQHVFESVLISGTVRPPPGSSSQFCQVPQSDKSELTELKVADPACYQSSSVSSRFDSQDVSCRSLSDVWNDAADDVQNRLHSAIADDLDASVGPDKQLSPEPRPCLTPHSTKKRNVQHSQYRLSKGPSNVSLHSVLPPPFDPCSKVETENSDDALSSVSSSPNDFVVVKPSALHSENHTVKPNRIQFRCLVPSTGSYDESHQFHVQNNHYPHPSDLVTATSRNRGTRLFRDPPSIYPKAHWALTLYNFAMEWNLYGGADLAPVGTSYTQSAPSDMETSVVEQSNPSVNAPNNVGSLGGSGTPGQKRSTYRFRHDRPAIEPTKSPITTAVGVLRLQKSDHTNKATGNAPKPCTSGGRNRDSSKCISVLLEKIYFRYASFPPVNQTDCSTSAAAGVPKSLKMPGPHGDPASRFVISVGSLVVIDKVATSKINHLLYSHAKISPGSSVPHNVDTPIFRLTVVCWRVPTVVNVTSLITTNDRSLRGSSTQLNSSSDSLPSSSALDDRTESTLELEAKVSCQPLRIHLDQYTLMFMEEFQQTLIRFTCTTHCCDATGLFSQSHENHRRNTSPSVTNPNASPLRSRLPNVSTHASLDDVRTSIRTLSQHRPSSRGSLTKGGTIESFSPSVNPNVFIRKVTFYPDLPIRLDYLGRHLDWSGGSLQGLARMLLQLNNAEIVIPRRVYRRGYPNLDRLLEEVLTDMRSVLIAQLPQLLATSVGPMHEVTHFLIGLWDLIYQPVNSLYRGSRSLSALHADSLRTYWQSADLDMSTYDPSLTTASTETVSVGSGFIQGLRSGTRSFSTSTLWATLQLSIQGVRAIQSIAETAYDLVTPGPALRSRQLRLRQPANLREGFGNAANAVSRGFQMVTEDLFGATQTQSEIEVGYKGPVGVVGDVLRQIPPTIVAPLVTGCEATANILGGFRNQLRPEAKQEDEQKWKDTKGL